MTRICTIVIIGGTGNFGRRIVKRLVGEENTRLIITSRRKDQADKMLAALELSNPDQSVIAVSLDQFAVSFADDLAVLNPDIVIHTAGPYQGQGYQVAEACIACGAHYIDLADGRDFVLNFHQLDGRAKEAGLLLVTGASTLPGLSGAVFHHLAPEFDEILKVNISIAPAHQTPRGNGTIAAVLSYCGKPFEVLEDGSWKTLYGWHDIKRQWYPTLGRRYSAVCDVPDLALLPAIYPALDTVTFHAALEAWWEHLALWSMGWTTRIGLVKRWDAAIPLFRFIGEKLIRLGSTRGGMHIRLTGLDENRQHKIVSWYLTASQNHGPEIPCAPALVLARKLARGDISNRGAVTCFGQVTLEEFSREVEDLDISWEIQKQEFS